MTSRPWPPGCATRHLDVGWAVERCCGRAASSLERAWAGDPSWASGFRRRGCPPLEVFNPLPNTLVLAEWAESLGQNLFYPPNVGGWAGGRAWLTTARCDRPRRFAADLVAGRPIGCSSRSMPNLWQRHGRDGGLVDQVAFFAELVTGREPSPACATRLSWISLARVLSSPRRRGVRSP